MASNSSIFAISFLANWRSLGPVQYGARWIGYVSSGNELILCLPALINPMWTCNTYLNFDNISMNLGPSWL